jgi:hypothetical protein
MTTTAMLTRYRLRPVPWGWLTALAAGWFLATRLLVGIPGDPEIGVLLFRRAALLLGLGAAILTAPETDPPREVLRAGPVPLRRTLALRLAGWLLLAATPVLILAVGHGDIAGWRTIDLVWGALPNFLLVTAAGFLAASRTSVLGGGAAAMAAVVALSTAGRAWPAWFPIQLDSVPGDRHWQSSRAWMIGLGLVLVATALVTEGRTGTRLGVPRRRRGPARPGQAAKVRAGP